MCVKEDGTFSQLRHEGCSRPNCQYSFYDVSQVCEKYSRLPYCKRVLLECAVRKSFTTTDPKVTGVWKSTVHQLLLQCCGPNTNGGKPDVLNHEIEGIKDCDMGLESIMFHPGRVVLQDFTGVAALVDLAALRDTVDKKIDDLSKVDSQCPADLVVDNFVQVRYWEKFSASIQKLYIYIYNIYICVGLSLKFTEHK